MPAMLGAPRARSGGQRIGLRAAVIRRPSPLRALELDPLPPTPRCLVAGHAAFVAAALRAGTGAGMAGVLWGGGGVTLGAGTGAGMASVLWGAASATAGMLGGTGAGTRRPPPAATAPDALPSTSTPTSASGPPPGTRRKRDGLQSIGCAETLVLW
jgi:hypothetical protein